MARELEEGVCLVHRVLYPLQTAGSNKTGRQRKTLETHQPYLLGQRYQLPQVPAPHHPQKQRQDQLETILR